MRGFLISLIFSVVIFANDSLVVTQQNVLNIQNMIKQEEKIAQAYEKYLLDELKIPTMNDLTTDKYLGSNFSLVNKFSDETIGFKSALNLQIKYALKNDTQESYMKELYNRDLYRLYTSAFEGSAYVNSHTTIVLQSKKAKTIYNILKASNTIQKECVGALSNTYCKKNEATIRWYDDASNWIEYDMENFENSNITVSSTIVLHNTKLNNLPTGVYIFVNNGFKYIKLFSSIALVE